jgi:hypothetical protein
MVLHSDCSWINLRLTTAGDRVFVVGRFWDLKA